MGRACRSRRKRGLSFSTPTGDRTRQRDGGMRKMTAIEASRNFSDLLDTVERGETVTITRGHRPVATIGPAVQRTGADLRAALEGMPALDKGFADDIAESMALVVERSDTWDSV